MAVDKEGKTSNPQKRFILILISAKASIILLMLMIRAGDLNRALNASIKRLRNCLALFHSE